MSTHGKPPISRKKLITISLATKSSPHHKITLTHTNTPIESAVMGVVLNGSHLPVDGVVATKSTWTLTEPLEVQAAEIVQQDLPDIDRSSCWM